MTHPQYQIDFPNRFQWKLTPIDLYAVNSLCSVVMKLVNAFLSPTKPFFHHSKGNAHPTNALFGVWDYTAR